MPRLLRPLLALAAGTIGCALPRAGRTQDVFPAAPRLVAIGDVHGDYEQFVTLLKQAVARR